MFRILPILQNVDSRYDRIQSSEVLKCVLPLKFEEKRKPQSQSKLQSPSWNSQTSRFKSIVKHCFGTVRSIQCLFTELHLASSYPSWYHSTSVQSKDCQLQMSVAPPVDPHSLPPKPGTHMAVEALEYCPQEQSIMGLQWGAG